MSGWDNYWRILAISAVYGKGLYDDVRREAMIEERKGLESISIPLPEGEVVIRLDTYRTKNVWWKRPFVGKYDTRLYAMTEKGVYDITEVVENSKKG